MPAKTIISQAKDKMNKSIHSLEEKLQSLRTGQASTQQFETLMVDYYGTPTPLKQIGNISIPEPRLVVIQPWDSSSLAAIEKAIINVNTSINPQNDGKLIRINIPPLTDETRSQNVKQAKQLAEDARVAVRNIRRDANDKLKKLQHDGDVSEDELKSFEHDTQKLTDNTITDIQNILNNKEKEINEI